MHNIDNNFEIVQMFERKLASYLSFNECICTASCTDALMISLEAKRILKQIDKQSSCLLVPKHTYLSVPMALARNGWKFKFIDNCWHGAYSIGCLVIDAATDFREGLGHEWSDVEDCTVCISF